MTWISIKNGLPETHLGKEFKYSIYMAVIIESENYPVIARLEIGDTFKQWYCPFFDDTLEDVTHWCELPNPPRP